MSDVVCSPLSQKMYRHNSDVSTGFSGLYFFRPYMANLATRASNKTKVGLIKFALAIGILFGLIGIPYLIFTEAWKLLTGLFHQHPIWFFLLIIPIVYLAVKLWQWLYGLLGATFMAIGGIVDRLEKEEK
jgi:hypothetical protein